MLAVVLKGVAAIVDLPFLLLYIVLSWPISVFVGIHKLFRNIEGCSNILGDAERYNSDRKNRRLSILDRENDHSVSTVTGKDSGEDTTSDESSEVYSIALDPSIWQAGKRENTFFGPSSGASVGKDDFFRSRSYTTSGARKRTRSPPLMEIAQEDCKDVKEQLRDQCKHRSSFEDFTSRPRRETCIFKAPENKHLPIRGNSICEIPTTVFDCRSSIYPLIPIASPSTKLTSAEESAGLPAKTRHSMRCRSYSITRNGVRSNVSLRKVFKKDDDPNEPLSVPRARSNQFSAFVFRLKEFVPKRLVQRLKTQTEDPSSPSTISRLNMKARERLSVYSGSFRTADQIY